MLLPKEVSTHVDWSTLTLVPGAFVDEALQANYSDLLYSVKFQGKEGFIYVLWEHQSSPDRFLIFRELKYVVRFLDNWLVDHPDATHLPIVIPIVLAHGRRPWTCPLSFEDLLDIPAELKPAIIDYVPRFRVLLDDLYHETDEGLRSRSLSTYPYQNDGRGGRWRLAARRDGPTTRGASRRLGKEGEAAVRPTYWFKSSIAIST
ncbi:MAG: Rpn family recombination-promoting nuclease/putative transposase [Polyangiaceae bacterium]|nr:Rpn family recombination-promoting nuclease/putative transposase [Polyangiaceae bacterium]